MDRLAVNESRMLYFHRVLVAEARRAPGLLERARTELARRHAQRPDPHGVWAEWLDLLNGPFEALAEAVLADSPRGGLLRANSPLADCLGAEEKNALWQRIGLHQFVAMFLQAANDLHLTIEEQAALTGLPEDEVAGWRAAAPASMAAEVLEALKIVVGVHRALERLFPDPDTRRAWLRSPVDLFAAPPIGLILAGDGGRVQAYLTAALQPIISDADRPSH
jgi:hypothetical protein